MERLDRFVEMIYFFLNNSEFVTTLTEENAIAAAAIAGFNRIPVKGNRTPAAMGIPTTL